MPVNNQVGESTVKNEKVDELVMLLIREHFLNQGLRRPQ